MQAWLPPPRDRDYCSLARTVSATQPAHAHDASVPHAPRDDSHKVFGLLTPVRTSQEGVKDGQCLGGVAHSVGLLPYCAVLSATSKELFKQLQPKRTGLGIQCNHNGDRSSATTTHLLSYFLTLLICFSLERCILSGAVLVLYVMKIIKL